jgi:hypothetical protein
MLALAPVALVASGGVMAIVRAYFIGAAVRLVISLSGCLMMVHLFPSSMRAVLLTVVGMYVALLMVEAALVASHLWHLPSAASQAGPQTRGPTPISECLK